MTALAKGIYTLAFIGLSMMQPTAQWFCTATKSICATPTPECCPSSQHDCCAGDTSRKEDAPCCVEVDGDWRAIPAKAASVPEPSVAECFLPNPADFFEVPVHESFENWVFTGTDPPPLESAYLELFCLRLI